MSFTGCATTHVVTPDGARLAVQCSGSGPTLLLLPGQANSHTWWDDLRADLDAHCTCVTFAYRGTGESVASEDARWTMRTFADDAAAVLDAVGATRVLVYAASMGGRVAQVLAGTTSRVERMVLACTNPGDPLAVPPSEEAKRELRHGGAAAVLNLMYTPAWFTRGLRSNLLGDRTMTPKARWLHRKISDDTDAAHALPHITAPTLIMHGTEDRMVKPENATILHRHIHGSTLLLSPGRHGFFDEFADEITPQVIDFLLG